MLNQKLPFQGPGNFILVIQLNNWRTSFEKIVEIHMFSNKKLIENIYYVLNLF